MLLFVFVRSKMLHLRSWGQNDLKDFLIICQELLELSLVVWVQSHKHYSLKSFFQRQNYFVRVDCRQRSLTRTNLSLRLNCHLPQQIKAYFQSGLMGLLALLRFVSLWFLRRKGFLLLVLLCILKQYFFMKNSTCKVFHQTVSADSWGLSVGLSCCKFFHFCSPKLYCCDLLFLFFSSRAQ